MTAQHSPTPCDVFSSDAQLAAAAQLVSGILSAQPERAGEASELLMSAYEQVQRFVARVGNAAPVAAARKAAVDVSDSIQPGYLVCLEDGKKLKMLKRYLKTNYQMTPEQYRKRWNLPATYPMVAPDYAQKRSQLAKDIGLGKVGKPSATISRKDRMEQTARARHAAMADAA